MLRISAFETPEGTGWDLSTGLAARPEDEEAYLGEKMVERDGVRRCLSCHTTSIHAVLKDAGPAAADHSIGCETCHGPGGHHETAVAAGFSDSAIAGTRASSAAEINQTCGRCHGFPRWEKLALSRTDPALYRFQALGMSWSRCYVESDGNLSCVTCHDPHRNVQKSVAINEGKCLSCHANRDVTEITTSGSKRPSVPDLKPDFSHSLRPAKPAKTICPVNPNRGCLGCHMPSTRQKESHSIKTDHFIRVREPSISDGSSTTGRMR